MAKTNVNFQHQPLPEKIERRIAELIEMGEFDQQDVDHCRSTYWAARGVWHEILVACYETALQRQQRAAAPAPPVPAPAPRPAVRAARPLAQGAAA